MEVSELRQLAEAAEEIVDKMQESFAIEQLAIRLRWDDRTVTIEQSGPGAAPTISIE